MLFLCNKNVFSFWCMLFFCNIANVAQRTLEIIQKSRSHEHGDIINYIDKNVERTSTAQVHESQDFHVRGTKDSSNILTNSESR